jgi:Tol biopolymer transport system component
MPTEPLPAAMGQFSGPTLLLTPDDRFLRLTDATGSQFLWLSASESVCNRLNSSLSQTAAWSPDGRYIAVMCEGSTDGRETWYTSVLDTQGGETRRLNPNDRDNTLIRTEHDPWSPNGSQLLIVTQEYPETTDATVSTNPRDVWAVADAATGNITPLAAFEAGQTTAAAWSPDGTQVALYGKRVGEEAWDMVLVNADGSNQRRLPLAEDSQVAGFGGPLAWGGDGSFLLLTRQLSTPPNTFQALRYDIDSNTTTVIADGMEEKARFRMSPDGQSYAVGVPIGDSLAKLDWRIFNADGTPAAALPADTGRDDLDLAWAGESRFVLASVRPGFGTELYTGDAATGSMQLFARFADIVTTVDSLQLAPDGTTLVYLAPVGNAILDSQGNLQALLAGRAWGWRPAAQR